MDPLGELLGTWTLQKNAIPLFGTPDPAGSIWGLSNIPSPKKQPFRHPFADLSRAFARSIFLRCATSLIQILFTCPVFDRLVECLEVLFGSYMVRGPK